MAVTSMTFDESYYLNQNPDVLTAILNGFFTNAQQHFELVGYKELRDPNQYFDSSYYLANNADVLNAGVNPFTHFITNGAAENRAPTQALASAGTSFDSATYLSTYPDVQTAISSGAFSSAYQHWILIGQFESRTAQTTDGSALTGAGTTTSSGSTFTLTTGTDSGSSFTGTTGDDTFDASGFFNSGTGTTIVTLGNADSLAGGGGTDTLNALLTANATITPAALTSIEVINGTFTTNAGATLSLANATGVTTIGSLNSSVAAVFSNIQSAPTAYNITNGSSNFTANVVNTALAGTSDSATLTLNGVTGGTVTIQTATAASGYETLSIVSGGNSANTLTALTDGNATSLATLNVSGAQNLNLGTTLDATVATVDASSMTGALTMVQTNTVKSTITGGSGNDVIDLSGGFVDGTDATNADVVNGGSGTDSLQLTSAEVAAVGSAAQWANVTNIETVIIDTAVAGALRLDFLTGVTTVEFDGGIGAFSHNITSGMEIQYDTLDADDDAQTFTVSGSGTSDTMTIDINGVDIGAGTQTYAGIETVNILTSGTSVIDGAHVMDTSAATQTMNISGTGTLTLGNITADVVNASGMTSGTLNLGTLQVATNFTGGASADTVVGSTAADILLGGAGADFLTNTATGANASAGDILTGGDGFDTFTLIGSSASAANYNGGPNITDFTVGTSATNTDFLRLSSNNADYGAGLSVDGTAAGASGTVGVLNIAQSAGATAGTDAATEFVKLTTGVAFNTNTQTTFNDAIGTSTVTTLSTGTYAASYYDTTNSKMVILEVATADATLGTGDTVRLIGTIDMTSSDYANFDADNFANFL